MVHGRAGGCLGPRVCNASAILLRPSTKTAGCLDLPLQLFAHRAAAGGNAVIRLDKAAEDSTAMRWSFIDPVARTAD